jgi:hypothetical protein
VTAPLPVGLGPGPGLTRMSKYLPSKFGYTIIYKICIMRQALPPLSRSALLSFVRLASMTLCLVIMNTMRPVHAFAVVQPFVSGPGICRRICIASHGVHLNLQGPVQSRLDTAFWRINIDVRVSKSHTRLYALEDGLDDSNLGADFSSAREKHPESPPLNKPDSAENIMVKKFASKQDPRLHTLRRQLVQRFGRLDDSLDQVRPGIKRITSSPKLMALSLATCLVAVPAGVIALFIVLKAGFPNHSKPADHRLPLALTDIVAGYCHGRNPSTPGCIDDHIHDLDGLGGVPRRSQTTRR